MKRHYKPDLGNLYLHNVRPETAHWKYLSFKVAAIAAGQELAGNTGDEEVVVVPLVGRGKITFNRETHQLGREDLFRELADALSILRILGSLRFSHATPPWLSSQLQRLC